MKIQSFVIPSPGDYLSDVSSGRTMPPVAQAPVREVKRGGGALRFFQVAFSIFFAPALRQVEPAKRNGESPGAANSNSASPASREPARREDGGIADSWRR